MILLDTDILGHLQRGNAKVLKRLSEANQVIAITTITRIEVLRGRFDSVFKAANGGQLLSACRLLVNVEADLADRPVVPLDEEAANEFDRLLQNKKLKKIGRGDLLIASIALANKATLVTRNLKDFQLVPGLRTENWAD